MAVKAITFDKFDLGIDLRKGASVSDANRLREMLNAYVTTGLATQKRPGLAKVATLEAGTKGLFASGGKLHTFYAHGTLTHANPLFVANLAVHPATNLDIAQVWFADIFNGFIYAAIEYANGDVYHHYLDGSDTTHISGENAPRSRAVIKAANKMFAVSGDVVRYSATDKPRDWTTANDAGFLPTGLRFEGDRNANALGIYQKNLVVLATDGAQVWEVDPDPTAIRLSDAVANVGTSYPKTVASVSGDLYFLSDFGFRSITTLQYTNNLADADIGSPIDTLVRQSLRNPGSEPDAFYHYGSGQYMCLIGNLVFVYSISRQSKIAAWSRYQLPFIVDAHATLGGQLYLRSGDDVYRFSDGAHDDDGQPFEVVLELPYMDLKSPGQMKRIVGADVVMEGEAEFSVAYDVRYPDDAYTAPVLVRGNTRPIGVIPVECSGTEFSLRFRCRNSQPFRLDAVTLYFESLGAV